LAVMDQKETIQALAIEAKDVDYLISLGENHFFERNSGPKEKMGLHFPVLLKNGMIVEAEEVAEVTIPVSAHNWVFADATAMIRIKELLGNASKNQKELCS